MFTIGRRVWVLLLAGVLMLSVCACGSNQTGNKENTQETETEKEVEIVDATDILTKVWNEYEAVDTDGNMYNDRFDVMGGHFESAVMNMPAKYDLTKTSDLALMYCVPETVIPMIDDAGTIVHLMKASTFTAGAYHVTDVANVKTVVEGIKTQTLGNQWLGGFPDKLVMVIINEQYIVSVYGAEEVVDNFEMVLSDIYGKQMQIITKEKIH